MPNLTHRDEQARRARAADGVSTSPSTPRPSTPVHPLHVSRVGRVSPHMIRITATGPSLRDYVDVGPDQRFKLLLPRPGQDRLTLPEGPDFYAAFRRMPPQQRPIMHTYTIRHLIDERCLPRDAVCFGAYWKRGVSIDEELQRS
jgi:NADPH-dependent ferric siderophore reductase